jgi:DNA-binding CsgD family transcriptional regulator
MPTRSARREATLEFLLLAAEEEGERPFPEPVLEALLDVVPCETVAYRAWSRELGILDRSFAPGDLEQRWKTWLQYPSFRGDDPHPSELPGRNGGPPSVSGRSQIGTPLVLTDAVAARRFRQTGLYFELMKPFGVRDVLKLFLPSERGVASAFVFDTSGAGFSDDDRLLLTRLVPLLVQFRRNASLRSARRQQPGPLRLLTRREVTVLGRAAAGETNAEIAAALWIGESTVRKHLEHIYEKLQVRNRAGAAAEYMKASRSPTDMSRP